MDHFKKSKTRLSKAFAEIFSAPQSFVTPNVIFQELGLFEPVRPAAPFNLHLLPKKNKFYLGSNKKFRPEAVNLYNGKTPFVVVDIANDTPTRGDSNGYVGVATRLAAEIGARLRIIDHTVLAEMYPDIAVTDKEIDKSSSTYYARLQKRRAVYFEEEGYPDFYFTRVQGGIRETLNKRASGLLVTAYNESLAYSVIPSYRDRPDAGRFVPHHLTPEILAFEGQKFAQEFAELPRPFIGINLAEISGYKPLTKKMLELAAVYEEATFFLCSCHRTDPRSYEAFVHFLREEFAHLRDRFHIVDFDYRFYAGNYAAPDFWNIYKGLLDQADHLILSGESASMLSEALATGKTCYVTSVPAYDGYSKDLFSHEAGKPLKTERITPLDLTEECVQGLLQKFKEHKKVRKSSEFRRVMKTRKCPSDSPSNFYSHLDSYMNI